MEKVLCLVLGGGHGAGLYPLTKLRSKGAIPIGGTYRLIDIPLSNCLNSGLTRIYVVTQYLSASLHQHISNTYKFDPFNRGFVEVLAAQVTNEAADWYRGTADAIRQNIPYLNDEQSREYLILSDDQIYRFDFRNLLQAHRDRQADVTMAVAPVARQQASALGILRMDETGRITAFVEKPQTPEELDRLRIPEGWLERQGLTAPPGGGYFGNMGIYLFNREALFKLLNTPPFEHSLESGVFPRTLEEYHFQGYLFRENWQHLETIKAYHEASLALAGENPPFDFHNSEGFIYTRMRNLPASRVTGAKLDRCLISDGCRIGKGTDLERCVIGIRSCIGRNVTMRDTVVMGANFYESDRKAAEGRLPGSPPLGVGDGSVLERCIVEKNCRVGRQVRIVNRQHLEEGEGDNFVIRDGIVVIPVGAVVPDGTVI